MSLRDKIKNTNDIREEKVFVPEWDSEIVVKSMTGIDRALALNEAMDAGAVRNDVINVHLIVGCCYDPETGEKLFTMDDKEWLMAKNASAIELLVTKAMAVSGLGAGALADSEKN